MTGLPNGVSSQSDLWSAITTALQSFASGSVQPASIQILVNSLCRLNLGGIAAHLVSGLNVTGEFAALKEQWLQQARQAPVSTVAWASRKRRFAANIAALSAISPDLSALPAFWETVRDRYELHVAADGNILVYDTHNNSPFNAVLGGLRNHLAEAQQWTFQKSGPQFIMPVAFNGAGYGWLLSRILETTAKSYLSYSAAVYIVEPDPAAICILLHLQDLRFAADRLRFFVGSDAADHLRAALRDNLKWSLPGVFANSQLTIRPAPPLEKIRAELQEQRHARLCDLQKQADAHYAKLTLSDWRQRFADALVGKAKLTVMGITTRYSTVLQYSMAELGEAIKAAGHEFVLSIESDDQSVERPDLELIVRHKPDLLVQISRMRYENPWLPTRIPFMCWDQDNLPFLRTPEAKASLDDMTYVAGPAANTGFCRFGWPRRNCIVVPPAGQWHRYADEIADPLLLQKHAADFSYISNASVRPEELFAETRQQFADNPDLLARVDQAAHEILTRSVQGGLWSFGAIQELILKRVPGLRVQDQVYQSVEFALRQLADRSFRHATLGWIADYCRDTGRTLRLYGKGWENTPGLNTFAAGPATPGPQVTAIYRASRINLQIIESSFIHSRLLDGIAAGGFFLSRLSSVDYQDTPDWRALVWLVRWVRENNIDTSERLLAAANDEVRSYLPIALRYFGHKEINEILVKDLIVHYPYWTPTLNIPSLAETVFANREQFVRLAHHYLDNEPLRLELVRKLEQTMKDHYSYDTRWREFLTGVYQGISSSL